MSSTLPELRPSPDGGVGNSSCAGDASAGKRLGISWMATTIIFTNVGLALLIGVAIHVFGSVGAAAAYMRGDILIPDSYEKSFGEAATGRRPVVEFSLANWSRRPIKLLGTTSSCNCLVAIGFPVTIQPGQHATVGLRARSAGKPGPYSAQLRVISDPAQPDLVLSLWGDFR